MSTLFVSYRKEDTSGEAGRLADELQHALGRRFVFRDAVSISPGDQWDDALIEELAAAKIVLVLVGPKWLATLTDRLSDQRVDYLHKEVATALAARKRVIPVLLRGEPLSPADALPADLKALTSCQTMSLRDEAWSTDVNRLVDAIGRPYRYDLLTLRAIGAVTLITMAVWRLAAALAPDRAADFDFLRTVELTLIGLYALAELLFGYRHSRALAKRRRPAHG